MTGIGRRRSLRAVLAGSLAIGGLAAVFLAATSVLMLGPALASTKPLFASTVRAASEAPGYPVGAGSALSRSGGSPRRGTPPGAPSDVTATAGDASATVSWSPPASDGGSAITGYIVVPSSGSPVTVADVTSDVVTGLANGTSYTFVVEAVNGKGVGTVSAPSDGVTPNPPLTPNPPSTRSAPSFLLPLYDSSGADWSTACTGLTGTGSFVVADIGNPGGPGTAASGAWASKISDCGAAHVGVLGYVDTGYCQISLSTVENEVDDWYSWYGTDGLTGIFFDEVANPSNPSAATDCLSRSSSAVSYYQAIAAYVHGVAAGQTVTFNFGANPVSSWPLSSTFPSQNADIIVIFEDPYSEYLDYGGSGVAWSPAPWEAGYGAQHFSLLTYDASGIDLPTEFCSTVSSQDVGNVYVTPNAGWESLPPRAYFNGELATC